MKAATVKELKDELNNRTPKELLEFCLRLSKFKKENKELLTYLLFESDDEEEYIRNVKKEMDQQFEDINRRKYFYIRKSIRKIFTSTRKHIRYSLKKETEVELLIYFCTKLKDFSPSIFRNKSLKNLYHRQIEAIKKKLSTLHEDLQYDYGLELAELNS